MVPHCTDCITLTTCKTCENGYTAILGGSQCVITCTDPNCQTCSVAATCVTCNAGYSLNANAGTCVAAICDIQYCSACTNTTACTTCQQFYTLSADQSTCAPACATSVTNCVICASATTCSACALGFTLASASSCTAICSVSNCGTCATTTACKTCATGYTLSADGTTCDLYCPVLNCLTCSSATTCSACKTGLNLVTTNGKQTCVIQCGLGEVNTGTAATPVCAVCSSQIPNCMTCITSNAATVCTQCPTGYFIDGAGQCQLCSSLITNCWACSSAAICTTCQDTYVINSKNECSSAVSCAASVTNCLTCSTAGGTTCTKCIGGFTLSGAGTCSFTGTATYVFDPVTQTIGCQVGTYNNGTGCSACKDPSCYKCDITGCLACSNTYFVSAGVCKDCPSNCMTCSDDTTCTRCNDDYYLNDDGNCKSAGKGKKVNKGRDGHFYECPPGCSQCTIGVDGTLKCLTPSSGFSIVGGKIIPCNPSCLSCSGTTATSCTACYAGLVLSGGSCKTCSDPNALTCLAGNPAFSISCNQGYTATYIATAGGAVTAGSCVACAINCLQCDSTGPSNCDAGKCSAGFVVLVGTMNCTACLGGCPGCSPYNPAQCTACPDGQYFDTNNVCQPCSSSC